MHIFFWLAGLTHRFLGDIQEAALCFGYVLELFFWDYIIAAEGGVVQLLLILKLTHSFARDKYKDHNILSTTFYFEL